MRMKDFRCPACGKDLEELVDDDVKSMPCPACATAMETLWLSAPKVMTTCIPSYPGCHKHRAGYMHTHGDRSATKIQSGYGGSQGPKP